MSIPLLQVDAFTDKPFAGNPAAVCLLNEPRDASWMQAVAREMNLSETAFLHPQDGGYRLRWFTPAVEVDLCGHATIASVHALSEWGRLAAGARAEFHSNSGLLSATRSGDWIELNFPALHAKAEAPPFDIEKMLGAKPRFIGKSRFDYLVEVDTEQDVRKLQPNIQQMITLAVRGVIVTAKASTPEFDFISRFFAPGAGVAEDPVTGSAHCALAPYWRERLGKDEMLAYQASARGGVVGVRVAGDRVILRGKAVTVLRGELLA
jgi:PhzF family phenazine biosynthesis protein